MCSLRSSMSTLTRVGYRRRILIRYTSSLPEYRFCVRTTLRDPPTRSENWERR